MVAGSSNLGASSAVEMEAVVTDEAARFSRLLLRQQVSRAQRTTP